MRFEVKRSNWLRGEGDMDSYLLRAKDGKMCCLGFLGRSCGWSDDALKDRRTPVVFGFVPDFPDALDLRALDAAMHLNDNASITDQEREAELVKLFAQHGIEVVFND